MSFDWNRDTNSVIKKYFAQPKILVQHQLESYNNTVETVIPSIINHQNPIQIPGQWNNSTKKFERMYEIRFKDVYMCRPLIRDEHETIKPLYPQEARLRNLTYSAPIFVDLEQKLLDIKDPETPAVISEGIEKKVPLCNFPVMLQSNYCHLAEAEPRDLPELGENLFDIGGYFIINGSEKVIIPQERPAENKVLCFQRKGDFDIVEIKSTIDQRFNPVNNISVALSRQKDSDSDRIMTVNMKSAKQINLFVIFRALGIETDFQILQMILGLNSSAVNSNSTNTETASINDADLNLLTPTAFEVFKGQRFGNNSKLEYKITNQLQALRYIASQMTINQAYVDQQVSKTGVNLTEAQKVEAKDNYMIKYVREILARDFLPHVGRDYYEKAVFLAYMTRRLLDSVQGRRPYDDRDHYANKRLDLTGILLIKIFRENFTKLVRDIKNCISMVMEKSEIQGVDPSIRKIVQNCKIESSLKYALATGDWSTGRSSTSKPSNTSVGIAQVLSRLSLPGTISYLRRLQSPLEKEGGKLVAPRRLHGSQIGRICPNETPEGQQVGVVKNLALTAKITLDHSSVSVYFILQKLHLIPLKKLDFGILAYTVKVFVNGRWVGNARNTDHASKIHKNLSYYKRTRSPDLGVSWNFEYQEIHIRSDGGRYLRPLYLVEFDSEAIKNFEPDQYDKLHPNRLLIDKHWASVKDLSWKQLLLLGSQVGGGQMEPIIEYLDVEEEENALVAPMPDIMNRYFKNNEFMFHRYTHCEIHPALWLGVISSVIPFSDHNQSPRNCYQCLWEEETVLMVDQTYKKIKDIQIGEKIITVDPKTLETSPATVINQYVKDTEKQIIELITLSGRKLICTDDHPILTNNGWKKAIDIENNDMVCVYPQQISYTTDKTDIVLDASQFIDYCNSIEIKESLMMKHLKELTQLNLLPLYQNNPATPILARIYGFCQSDGHVAVYRNQPHISLSFGSYEGALDYLKDMAFLGINHNKITKVSGEVHGVIHHGWQIIYNNCIASLIISLGVNLGKKTESFSNPLPSWIIKGSTQVKREFLAGFQGGDGCKIRFNFLNGRKSPNYILNMTSQQKSKKYMDSHIILLNQVKALFEEFGIICKKLYVEKYSLHEDRYTIAIPFECSRDNIINYFEKIGYRYDHHKTFQSLPIYEYLKYQQYIINQIDVLKININTLKDEGKNYTEIGDILNISNKKAADLYRSRNYKSRLPNINITINEWFNLIEQRGHFIFMPLGSIKKHPNVRIADITIDRESHSFITGNGLVVHNSSMGKQAIGLYATSFNQRMDTSGTNVLCYPQKPLVNNRASEYFGLDQAPHGEQLMVAIACFTGYNQEDSTMMNVSAIERGRFNSLHFKTDVIKINKRKASTGEEEKFGPRTPKEKTKDLKGNHRDHDRAYRFLDPETGIIRVGTKFDDLEPDEEIVLVNKYVMNKPSVGQSSTPYEYKDISLTSRPERDAIIDKVIGPNSSVMNTDADGNLFVKVREVSMRKPEIGDKAASRSAQKGTIGMLYRQEEMPFTGNGLVPDLIMNPHAIPSRMTIAQVLECLISKVAVQKCISVDSTPFTNPSPDTYDIDDPMKYYTKVLSDFDLHPQGEEVMYNPMTGEQFEATIFFGPTYYQRLKHMVGDKLHARETGPVKMTTRQPSDGRARDGGFRLGEMERDVLISHSASQFLTERLLHSSDLFRVFVGKEAETVIVANSDKGIYRYNNKDLNPDQVREIHMPYAMELFRKELTSCGIDLRLLTD